MKRAGFTMIELIFVIVILGILAAVALPKFAGVSDQANAQKCKAFVGTLNRTVGPSMWSEAYDESNNTTGIVSTPTNGASIDPLDHIALGDIPATCLTAAATPLVDGSELFDGATDIKFGESTYTFGFTDGSTSDSPRWTWSKNNP